MPMASANVNDSDSGEQVSSLSIEIVDSETAVTSSVKPSSRRGRYPAAKRPPTSPDLFSAGVTERMASNRLIWEGANILSQGSSLEWADLENEPLQYRSPVAKGKGFISFWITNDLHRTHPTLLEGEVALALIEQFDIRAACLHLIYAALATQVERPWEQQFVVSDRQLEKYLALDKNKKLNKQQKLEMLLQLAKQPCSLQVYVSWPDKGKVKSFSVSRTWLWEISEPILHFQETLSGESELIGFTLKVRAGNWAEHFLNGERCKDGSGYYEYSFLSQSILQDVMGLWYNHEGAARLMLWLLFKTRVSNEPVRVGTLMKIAFGPEKVEKARAGAYERKRLVKQWKTALIVLSDRRWKITFDAATYPPQYLPDFPNLTPLSDIPDDPNEAANFWMEDAQKQDGDRLTDTVRKPYGGFEQLLSSHVLIQPPSEIAQKLEEIKENRFNDDPGSNKTPLLSDPEHVKPERKPIPNKRTKAVPAAKSSSSSIQSGQQLKEMRVAKGMTQSTLATKIGKSTSWVKLVETGRRSITDADQALLTQIFASL
jgi:DNA-binding transcriptional regulator YiaG